MPYGVPSTLGGGGSPFAAGATAGADGSTPAATGSDGGGGGGAGGGGDAGAGGNANGVSTPNAISGNPAASNIVTGTGRLGEVLGIDRNGWRVGGLTIGGRQRDPQRRPRSRQMDGEQPDDRRPVARPGGTISAGRVPLVGTQYLYITSGGPGYTVDGIVQGRDNTNALAGRDGLQLARGTPPAQPRTSCMSSGIASRCSTTSSSSASASRSRRSTSTTSSAPCR